MSHRALALAFALSAQIAPLHAQPTRSTPAKPDTVDRLVAAEMARKHIPGVSLAVVRVGKVIKAKGYGMADLEHGITHTSGVLREGPAFDAFKVQPDSVVIESAFARPLEFPTGSKCQYCNVCYFTLADVIARVSGKPWDVFLAERLFRPMGMMATRTTTTTALVAQRARGYTWRDSGYVNAPDLLALRPSGAFLSTVLDLARWDAALYEDRMLTKVNRAAMWTPVRLPDGSSAGYGFGWELDSLDGHWQVHHGGSLPGFRAEMSRYPNDSLTVIVLTNADDAQPSQIARGVTGLYLSTARPANRR